MRTVILVLLVAVLAVTALAGVPMPTLPASPAQIQSASCGGRVVLVAMYDYEPEHPDYWYGGAVFFEGEHRPFFVGIGDSDRARAGEPWTYYVDLDRDGYAEEVLSESEWESDPRTICDLALQAR